MGCLRSGETVNGMKSVIITQACKDKFDFTVGCGVLSLVPSVSDMPLSEGTFREY